MSQCLELGVFQLLFFEPLRAFSILRNGHARQDLPQALIFLGQLEPTEVTTPTKQFLEGEAETGRLDSAGVVWLRSLLGIAVRAGSVRTC